MTPKKKKQAAIRKQQSQARPGARLQEARSALQQGNAQAAVALTAVVLRTANDLPTIQQAKQIWVEAHLHLAATSPTLQQQLENLDQAENHGTDQARIHYQRGLVLWRMGKAAEALAALEQAYRLEPTRPGLQFLCQLGRLRTGQPVQSTGLNAAEAERLQQLLNAKQGKQPTKLDASDLWTPLLQMAHDPKAAPVAALAEAVKATTPPQSKALVQYYQGVAARRQGDNELAQQLWSALPLGLMPPTIAATLVNFQREHATVLAQTEQWPALVALYQTVAQTRAADTLERGFLELAGLAHFHVGFAAAEQQDWTVAADYFRTANTLLPSRQLAQNLALAEEAQEHWLAAAEAWRDMIKRRPRKTDHPDYLSDAQVAAIWAHTANCYRQLDNTEEVITCLKNALKYDTTNVELRLTLADLLQDDDRDEAAENELQRILEIDANSVAALTRLGVLWTGRWDRDSKPIWERVLAIEPQNQDAQLALARIYRDLATGDNGFFGYFGAKPVRKAKDALKILAEGLEKLPNHPLLLVTRGDVYYESKKFAQARTNYEQAAEIAIDRRDLATVNHALHELLHVDGGTELKKLMPRVSRWPGLLATFWVEQGEQAMQCELGEEWAVLLWDEAVQLAEQSPTGGSLAATLVKVQQAAHHNELGAVANRYEKRLRAEFPHSGAIEFLEATEIFLKTPNRKSAALALLRNGRAAAQKAKEPQIEELINDFELFVKNPPQLNPFADGPGGLLDLLGSLGKDELDALRRLF